MMSCLKTLRLNLNLSERVSFLYVLAILFSSPLRKALASMVPLVKAELKPSSELALMKPAADKLAVELAKITFNAPTVPVVNNVDVKCETNGDAIRDALVRQLYNPVQWTKSVEYMAAQGVEHLYEVGPGKVLTGLTKRIVDTLTASALNEPSAMAAALEL